MSKALAAARKLHAAGFLPIPISEGGKPLVAWEKLKGGYPLEQMEQMPWNGGLGMIIEGFEVLDFDLKNAASEEEGRKIWEDWKQTVCYVKADALDGLLVVSTRNKGWHIIYRTDAGEPSRQIATTKDGKVLIETRGKGGLVFTYPTPGYSRQQGHWTELPAITREHRALLIETARAFNEAPAIVPEQRTKEATNVRNGRTIFDAFNAANEINEMISTLGWKEVGRNGGRIYYNRPNGGGEDPSANVKDGRLWIFSTSVTELPIGESLSAFDVYRWYEHGGDMKSAVRQLYEMFPEYKDKGDIMANSPQLAAQGQAAQDMPYRFSAADEIEELVPFLSFVIDSQERHYIPQQGLFTLTGYAGSFKTSLLRAIAASFISGKQKAACKAQGQGKVVWFDTELSKAQFQKNMSNIMWQSVAKDDQRLEAYWLTPYSASERRAWIDRILAQTKDAGLVVIDGWRDLLKDFNDTKEVELLIGQLITWRQSTPATFAGVIHLNPGTNKMRGTLGTELLNKCDGVIQVDYDKDNGTTKVSFQRGRSWATPPAFQLMAGDRHTLWHLDDPGHTYVPPPKFDVVEDEFIPF